ncbi:hypothetical protein HanIR_Chr17g0901891 [Helianthus annuus]|nr:hypothetical protein HanIR_Chr17g0901891 [Helianthus annuus]
MVSSHHTAPTASLSHSNATNSPDPGATTGNSPSHYPHPAHAGSTCGQSARYYRQTPVKTVVTTLTHRSSFSVELPSNTQFYCGNFLTAIFLDPLPSHLC